VSKSLGLCVLFSLGLGACTDVYPIYGNALDLHSRRALDDFTVHAESAQPDFTQDKDLEENLGAPDEPIFGVPHGAETGQLDEEPGEFNDASTPPEALDDSLETSHDAAAEQIGAVNVAYAEATEDDTTFGDEAAWLSEEEIDDEETEEAFEAFSESHLTPIQAPWLLSVDNPERVLLKIDTSSGQSEVVCTFDQAVSYPSLTFGRDGTLFASRGGSALDIVDPCTCEIIELGEMSGHTGVNGITTDQGVGLFGVSSGSDVLLDIETTSGAGDVVGELGEDFGASGSTWSDDDEVLYAINSNDDGLYTVDPETGEATFVAALDLPFGSVGIELHPENEVIYACTNGADLRSVDKLTGEVTVIGPMGHVGGCSNLAAPYVPIACIDAL
jgi:hypothetical protein